MMKDIRDFPNEPKEFNKCHQCKCYFTGNRGRIYCLLCAPKTIEEDQLSIK
jgi:hypothetical protein